MDESSWEWESDAENEFKENKKNTVKMTEAAKRLSSNSWDSSSPKKNNSARKPVSWDTESECQETLVEPFSKNELSPKEKEKYSRSGDPWDSESKDIEMMRVIKANERPVCLSISSESLPDLSDDKLDEIQLGLSELQGDTCIRVKDLEENLCQQPIEGICLRVEDLEESVSRAEEESRLKIVDLEENLSRLEEDAKPKLQNMEELAELSDQEQDNTVWAIPTTVRSSCTSHSLDSEEDLLKNMTKQMFVGRKSKTVMDLQKRKLTVKSKSLEELTLTEAPVFLEDIVASNEGSVAKEHVSKNKEESLVDFLVSEGDEHRHFEEIECRTLNVLPLNEDDGEILEPDTEAGSSAAAEDKTEPKATPKEAESAAAEVPRACEVQRGQERESWVFFDESGQSQPVTMNEVSILLGGRSADTVLQNHKEHYLSSQEVMRSACSDVTHTDINPYVQESLHFFCQDDLRGEETSGKCLGLERKVGNMLLYIRSRTDLPRASVRFISVDTGMVHVWRRSRDFDSSPPSSEADARIQTSFEEINEETNQVGPVRTSLFENTQNPPRLPAKEGFRADVRRRRARNQQSSVSEGSSKIVQSLEEKLTKVEAKQRESDRMLQQEIIKNSELEKEIARLREELDNRDANTSFNKSQEIVDERKSLPVAPSEPCTPYSSFSGEIFPNRTAKEDKQEGSQDYIENNEDDEDDGDEDCEVLKSAIEKSSGGASPRKVDSLTQSSQASLTSSENSGFKEFDQNSSGKSEREKKQQDEESPQIKIEKLKQELMAEVEESKNILLFNGFSTELPETWQRTSTIKHYIRELTQILMTNNFGNRQMKKDEYCNIVKEKAALSTEVEHLKAERDLILESQIEQYDKLKEAIREQNTRCFALENDLKTCRSGKEKLSKINEQLWKRLKNETSKAERVLRENEQKLEVSEKLFNEKNEIIEKFIVDNERLFSNQEKNEKTIGLLNENIKKIEAEKSWIESEFNSLKESEREKTDYVSRLEAWLSQEQEKLRELNNKQNFLKKSNEILEKQRKVDLHKQKKLREELEETKEKTKAAEKKSKQLEQDRFFHMEKLLESERKKSTSLEKAVCEYQKLSEENSEKFEKTKQNFKKQLEKVEAAKVNAEVKYKNLKQECNERADLIRHLEMLLQKSDLEYNNRIALLEKEMSAIVEKISTYKQRTILKDLDEESNFSKLQLQLLDSKQERERLEREAEQCYDAVKRLEKTLAERNEAVQGMSWKLSEKTQLLEKLRRQANANAGGERGEREERLQEEVKMLEERCRECRRLLEDKEKRCEEERLEFDKTISQLTLQIDKYKLRIEVMMQNLAACGKTLSDIGQEKKIIGEIKKKNLELQEEVKRMSKTSVEKDKRIKALTENLKSLEKSKGGAEEVEIIRGQMSEMQKEITEAKRKMGMRQKERDEMADKLLKSVKLIMEERSARQAAEMVVAEKEKNLKEKLEDAKSDFLLLSKEKENFMKVIEEKKLTMEKLVEEVKKGKADVLQLKQQLCIYKEKYSVLEESEKSFRNKRNQEKMTVAESLKERLQETAKQLKRTRDTNILLRKTEGELRSKLVCLEDDVRTEKLRVKQLEGDLEMERRGRTMSCDRKSLGMSWKK